MARPNPKNHNQKKMPAAKIASKPLTNKVVEAGQNFDARRPTRAEREQRLWVYGLHAARAALLNKRRHIHRVLVTRDVAKQLGTALQHHPHDIVDRSTIDFALPADAVHQGIGVLVDPLPPYYLDDLFRSLSPRGHASVVVLDQITDPHNVGAILRSAAAFGAAAVIMLERGSPPLADTVAKTASGGLDLCPVVLVSNLAQAISKLKDNDFWCLGLSEEATEPLESVNLPDRVALLLGAEGPGLRRLTEELCDFNVSLPTRPDFSSLNVSNAAAIALYDIKRRQKKPL